jgi:hypothetical protein
MPMREEADIPGSQGARAQANALRRLAAAIELYAAVEATKAGIKPQDARKWLEAQRPPEARQRLRRPQQPTP